MKFGHTLYDLICHEWLPYCVDYKRMKRVLKGKPVDSNGNKEVRIVEPNEKETRVIDTEEFFRVYDASKARIDIFYSERERSARGKMDSLRRRVDELRHDPMLPSQAATGCVTASCEDLKESIMDFDQHLDQLIEFLDLNKTGFSKILKKYDKRVGASVRDEKFSELMTTHAFLDGEALFKLKEELEELEREVLQMECLDIEEEYVENDYSHEVTEMLQYVQENSSFFANNAPRALPRFKPEEVSMGNLLGEGEFGIVTEISQFNVPESCHICFLHRGYEVVSPEPSSFLISNVQDAQDSTSEEKISGSGSPESEGREHSPVSVTPSDITDIEELESDHEDDEIYNTRGFMNDHCMRDGLPRYAMKQLRDDLTGEMREAAACDIAMEAKFLAVLQHPHIVKMRGSGGVPGRPNFFIVLDRLYGTLAEKCAEWAERDKKAKRFFGLRKDRTKLGNLWVDRLLAAFDVARAMRHLHSQNILFRDLKPENIGFDIRGDAKIFDFGLAKELLPADQVGPDQFNASGMTGTRRYMPPEVALCKPYGLSADVYSFAILFWEVLSLKTAFKHYDHEKHAREVVLKRKRPIIPSSWPVLLKTLIEDSWSNDTVRRPSFTRVCDLLRGEISVHERTSMTDRSADLLMRSETSMCRYHGSK